MQADRQLSLTQLEGDDWGPPSFDSSVVTGVHRLRYKPLVDFTVEDLRLMIGQKVSLEYLLPLALEFLRLNPLLEGDCYPGDLLVSVLTIGPEYWRPHFEEREQVAELAKLALTIVTSSDEDTAIEQEAFRHALIVFNLSTN